MGCQYSRCPEHIAPVKFIHKKFKTLDSKGKAPNWLKKKNPCCFNIKVEGDEYYYQLTKGMTSLIEKEVSVKDRQETSACGAIDKVVDDDLKS